MLTQTLECKFCEGEDLVNACHIVGGYLVNERISSSETVNLGHQTLVQL